MSETAQKTDVVLATCFHCRVRQAYLPRALRINLRSDSVYDYRFFCLACRAYNQIPFKDLEQVEPLRDVGVPVNYEHIPEEVAEHPASDIPPITEAEVEVLCQEVQAPDFGISPETA